MQEKNQKGKAFPSLQTCGFPLPLLRGALTQGSAPQRPESIDQKSKINIIICYVRGYYYLSSGKG